METVRKDVAIKRVRFLRFRVESTWLDVTCFGIENEPNAYGHRCWRNYNAAQQALSLALRRYGKDHPEVYEPLIDIAYPHEISPT